MNCAGTTWRARLGDVDPEHFTDTHAVNVLGPLLGIQALTPLMSAGGSVVNIGSLAALQGHYPVAYTTSKWSLRGLTTVAALELAPRGIRVNVVHPGLHRHPDDRLCAGRVPRRIPGRDPAGARRTPGGGRRPSSRSCSATVPPSSPAPSSRSTAAPAPTAAPSRSPTRSAPYVHPTSVST